jgi:hypothetical protein
VSPDEFIVNSAELVVYRAALVAMLEEITTEALAGTFKSLTDSISDLDIRLTRLEAANA